MAVRIFRSSYQGLNCEDQGIGILFPYYIGCVFQELQKVTFYSWYITERMKYIITECKPL
jgi:hypothetical protein